MQQRFDTRSYSIRDFEKWNEDGELFLAPKFQRRYVWSSKARAFLIDTIIRGKPVPKIFMRLDINPSTRRTTREIVDGQQRIRTILDFLKDGFPILKIHNPEYAGMRFSDLEESIKRDILRYELAVDLLQDMPDEEIYDIFARLNTYSMVLNAQEQRNGHFFGEFKTLVYMLANEYTTFWQTYSIFSEQQLLRMTEAEFVSEVLIAVSLGIRARAKTLIDNFYEENDEVFPNRDLIENRFHEVMDIVGSILKDTLSTSKLRESRILYPLFCSIYHMQYGLPEATWERIEIKNQDSFKLRVALEHIDEIFEKLKSTEREDEEQNSGEEIENEKFEDYVDDEVELESDYDPLSPLERQFYESYSIRWVHAEKRRFLAEYISNLIVNALQ